MDFVKKNKFIIIAIAAFLVLVLLLVQVKNVFFPNIRNAVYGERLNGKKEVEVTKSQNSDIVSSIKSAEIVTKAKVTVNGRIINVIVTVNQEAGLEEAKGLSEKVLEKIDKDQKKYFDIQLFVKKDGESNEFPIIGYKHSNSDHFSWTKDRA